MKFINPLFYFQFGHCKYGELVRARNITIFHPKEEEKKTHAI
jgi:predicted proteasome-type protease